MLKLLDRISSFFLIKATKVVDYIDSKLRQINDWSKIIALILSITFFIISVSILLLFLPIFLWGLARDVEIREYTTPPVWIVVCPVVQDVNWEKEGF